MPSYITLPILSYETFSLYRNHIYKSTTYKSTHTDEKQKRNQLYPQRDICKRIAASENSFERLELKYKYY